MPHEQTLQQCTPRPSSTQWSESSFWGKKASQAKYLPICDPTSDSLVPSQALDCQLSLHETDPTCDHGPMVNPIQSIEQPRACPSTPPSSITIDNTPVGSPTLPLPHTPSLVETPFPQDPNCLIPLDQGTPQSHNEALQEFTNQQPMLIIS
ncbi:hypothetical protein O181_068137 [Austropuccinia psidii MF-1]|uniref:Uncharacterized protein n=1 Tax=Austropuccinia psidii MF-1 TaxID=1389203 RepID=A0A9Q3F1Z4_9BASI|nr:hypothetical protein [Austropuccinia psidii MF-1]